MSRKAAIQAENYTVKEKAESEHANSEQLSQQQQESDGLVIEGMALPFNKKSRNGVRYEKESIKENAASMIGNAILFNHNEDEPLGHVRNVEIKEDGLYYVGDINPERRESDSLERGDIPHVSIQALVEETENTRKTGEVAVSEFLELSAVTVPGFPQTDVETSEKVVSIEKLMTKSEVLESLENPEFDVGDFVMWEFGDGESQGEIIDMTAEVGDSMSAGGNEFTIEEDDGPLYKMKEWDEEAGEDGEFTNNVVKFEGALSETDRPEEAPSSAESFRAKEAFEFAPKPELILYKSKEDAMLRAERLGMDDVHRHIVAEEDYWMAGSTHEEWVQATENSMESNQEDQTSKEPFADYDDFDECVAQNQDKRDPEAYCAAIKRKAEIMAKKEALADVDLTPPERVKSAAQAALDWEENNPDRQDCGTGVGDSRANSITNETLSPEDFLGGENTAIPDYLESHEEDVTAEGTPSEWSDEEWNDCGNRQYAKWGFHLDWFREKEQELQEAKEEALNNIRGDSTITEEQDENEEKHENLKEAFSDLNEEDLIELTASHYEGISTEDLTELMQDFDFTGWDVRELASVVAEAMDVSTGDVLDMMDQADEGMHGGEEDDEEEAGDMDDEDDEMEKSESSNLNGTEESSSQDGDNSVSENQEQLEQRIEELEEEVQEKQNKIEELEETEESKQVGANTGSSESSEEEFDFDPEFANKLSR